MSAERDAGRSAGTGAPSPAADGDRDPRVAAAERLLHERGIEGARVSAAGHRREIAAIAAPAALAGAISAIAPELKALGFLYVALDLAAAGSDHRGSGPAARREPQPS